MSAGSYSEAIDAWQQAEKVAPDKMKSTVMYAEGMAHDSKKDRAQVMRIYQKLKVSDPNMAEGFFRDFVLPRPDEPPSEQRSRKR